MPKHSHHAPVQLRGEVRAFNISPKGHIEGVLLDTPDGSAQVNFPKHDSEVLSRSMKVGVKVTLQAELESDEHDHPVYKLRDAEAQVSGTVVRLNYALHGEVNGCHLEDGTFVHLKPEGAKKYKVRQGDRVTAVGTRRAGPDATVIEAHSLEKSPEKGRKRTSAAA